jgi:hypothetical protein
LLGKGKKQLRRCFIIIVPEPSGATEKSNLSHSLTTLIIIMT